MTSCVFSGLAEMKILALDSASTSGSVALVEGARLVAESLLNVPATHSERLLEQIEQVLAAAGLELAELDLIAVVRGPGSFTGLRTGLATAKGLAQAASLPLVGVSSLQQLAMNLPLTDLPVCAFLDARKKEVYTSLFHWRDGLPVAVCEEQVLPPRKALEQLETEVIMVGDAVSLYRDLIDEVLGARAFFPAACHHVPRASAAAFLARAEFRCGGNFSAAQLTPTYIRPSDAELNRSGRSQR